MIRKQKFGRTGHDSTVTIFGAASLGRVSQAEADRTLQTLLDYEVNHIDTAPSYGDSELRVGPWMEKHREKFFLATKTNKRTYQEAKDQIHLSLERLRTDHVDLIQFHGLVHPDEWDVAMGPGGVLEAAIEAKEQGLVHYIGVTGHNWTIAAMHKRSLQRYEFDSVLLPCNYLMMKKERYRSDFEELLTLCRERDVAVQTIKSIARGPWATHERDRTCWYQPLEEQDDIDRAVNYVLSRPGLFLNTVSDINLLPRVLDAASRAESAPSDDEMEAMLEGRKMTSIFGI